MEFVYADRGLKNQQEHFQLHPLKSEYQRRTVT